MWSPGLLFLLLMSPSLPVLGAQPDTSLDEWQPEQELEQNQHTSRSKKCVGWLKKNHRGVGEVLNAIVAPMPVVGPIASGALKTLLLLTPEADRLGAVISEVKALTFKFDTFRAEMKWDAWAAGAYRTPVNNIEKAWSRYTELVQTTNTDEETLKTNFFTFYSQYVDSTLVLHQFLTAKPVSINQNLGDSLADRLRCHEKDIKAQFLYLNQIMFKGNMLNEKYYEFKGTNADTWVNTANNIASESASALFASHKRCVSNSDAFIERDIFERIDDTKKHQEIADNIRAFLAITYDRYDWMVVAFTTHFSKHKPKLIKRHALSGFTEVQRGTVTVAVAKQVKGGHSKTADVKEAITKCLPESSKICLDVAQKLMKCQESVFGKRLSRTYTAVHTFKWKSHTSTSADEESEIPESYVSPKANPSQTPHIFTGKCGKFFGKFIVFIKSDEEIMGENPCSKHKCRNNGKCVAIPRTFIAMCKCQYPYYGEHCEMSLESYKRQLQRGTESRTRNPERFRKSKSAPPADRRSRKGTSPHVVDRRSRKGGSVPSSSRRSRKYTAPSVVDRRSRYPRELHKNTRR